MAERLTPQGEDGLGNISQATILSFIQQHKNSLERIAEAKAGVKFENKAHKDLRKRIKDAGLSLRAFDLAIEERDREDREEEERHYRYIMAAIGNSLMERDGIPVTGVMPGDPLGPPVTRVWLSEIDPGLEMPEHRDLRLDRVEADGYQAGKAGYDTSTNPHQIGSEEHALWANAWMRGQGDKVREEIAPPQDQPKRGPGRPRKDASNGVSP
jgi:ribosome modulation factor